MFSQRLYSKSKLIFLCCSTLVQSYSYISSAEPLPPLFINVASQDNALFISWYPDHRVNESDEVKEYLVVAKDSRGRTISRRRPPHGNCLLTGLENGVLWHVNLTELVNGQKTREAQSAGTPRARSKNAYFNYASDWLPNFQLFTSWDAANLWLEQKFALQFDGVNDSVAFNYPSPESNFTISATVKTTKTHEIVSESVWGFGSVANQNYLFCPDWYDGLNAGVGISVGTNGISVLEYGSNGLFAVAVYAGDIGTGWNHIAVTYMNKQPRIYLNGVLVRTGLTSPKENVFASKHLGGGPYGYFCGIVDNVRIWNYACTQQEIQNTMNVELNGDEEGLMGVWTFGEGSGTTVYDMSVNSYMGTLSDGPTWVEQKITSADVGIFPTNLYYRGQRIDRWSPDAPNGFYCYGRPDKLSFALARDLDSQFNMDQPFHKPNEVRALLLRILWPRGDHPFREISAFKVVRQETIAWAKRPECKITNVHLMSSHTGVDTIAASLITSNRSTARGLAIYHEGHGGNALDIGVDIIGYLIDSAWQVLALDMPQIGRNSRTQQNGPIHFSYALRDNGNEVPVVHFMVPIKIVIDWALSVSKAPQGNIIMVGRSGGGWASTVYSVMDGRIEYNIAIAGVAPQSIRLENDPLDSGDYEQLEPALYSYLPYEHLMLSAGSKGAYFIYNENDPFCFRIHKDSSFLKFLQRFDENSSRKIGFFIDPENHEHSASIKALEAMRVFLDEK